MPYIIKSEYSGKKLTNKMFMTYGEAHDWLSTSGDKIYHDGKIHRVSLPLKKKRVSIGSKSRVSSKSKRKNLYDWAWKQKGKGSISRIGKKMKSLSKTKSFGANVAVRQLGRIGDLKAAFNAGVKSRKR